MYLSYLKFISWTIALKCVFGAAEPPVPQRHPARQPRRGLGHVNAAYFVNWGIYQRNFQPQDLPASKLSHILYAFINVRSDGTVFTADTWADLEKHYQGDFMLSIGGWTWSSNFAAAASTATTRSAFAKSAVTLMKDWGFDGIDIDWEYPSSGQDADNMVLLLRAVRDEMDLYATKFAPGHHFQLSVAAPAGPEHYSKLRLSELADILDHVNIMAYDYAGSFGNVAGHTANLYANKDLPKSTPFNTDDAIKAYIEGGVPPEKLVLGMPIYGRSFLETPGLGEPYSGVGLANPGLGSWEAGIWDYSALPKEGAVINYDQKAQAYYSYNSNTRELVSFDPPDAVRNKVWYLQRLGLGGAMFWEASGDKVGSESLVETCFEALGTIDQTENWLDYPDSRYHNIVSGMECE
ncbi:Chitinase [Fusarium falciforme]|uniref:Chitinase n=1 Tax=Fusarium falciforme TaxID=195108 RepID=UPI0023005F8C|nr:Chitinase [Fusarium falciforme]WAO97137.1 Chitinase [Fusarium falciforme]